MCSSPPIQLSSQAFSEQAKKNMTGQPSTVNVEEEREQLLEHVCLGVYVCVRVCVCVLVCVCVCVVCVVCEVILSVCMLVKLNTQ